MKTKLMNVIVGVVLALGLLACEDQANSQDPSVPQEEVVNPGVGPTVTPSEDPRTIVSSMLPLEADPEKVGGILVEMWIPLDPTSPNPDVDEVYLHQIFPIDWTTYDNGGDYVQVDIKADPQSYYARLQLVDNDGVPIPTCAPFVTPVFEAIAHTNVSFGPDFMGIATLTCVDLPDDGSAIVNFPIDLVETPATVFFCDGNKVDYYYTKEGYAVTIHGCAMDTEGQAVTYTWELMERPGDCPMNGSVVLEDQGEGVAKVYATCPGIYVVRERVYNESYTSMNFFDWRFKVTAQEASVVRQQAELGVEMSVALNGSTLNGGSNINSYVCSDATGNSVSFEALGYETPVVFYSTVAGPVSMQIGPAGDPVVQAFVLKPGSDDMALSTECIAFDVDPTSGTLTFQAEENKKYIIMIEAAGMAEQQSFTLSN